MSLHEAIRHFVEVSGTYPASVTAQSAELAMRCRQHELEITDLERLKDNREATARIVAAANARHAAAGATQNGKPFTVEADDVWFILTTESDLVRRMMQLPEADLRTILAIRPSVRGREQWYRDQVERVFLSGIGGSMTY